MREEVGTRRKGPQVIAGSCQPPKRQVERKKIASGALRIFSTHHLELKLKVAALVSNRVDQVLIRLRRNYVSQYYQQNRLLNFCEAVS